MGKNIYVSSTFPNQPKFVNQSAYYIFQDPLIQLFLMIGKRQNVSEEEMMRMILANVSDQYREINLTITKVQNSDLKEIPNGKIAQYSQQFVVDLSNGFREFVTINLYRSADYDVMAITRFTLSPSEKTDLKFRMKGNEVTKTFHEETRVKISDENKQQ